jgi:hypothetical protein
MHVRSFGKEERPPSSTLPVANGGGPSSPRKVPYPSQEKGQKKKKKYLPGPLKNLKKSLTSLNNLKKKKK